MRGDQVGRVGNKEIHRPHDGKKRHGRHCAPRAEAVEPEADRKLHGEHRQEECAARPAELPGIEMEVAHEVGRDHGV